MKLRNKMVLLCISHFYRQRVAEMENEIERQKLLAALCNNRLLNRETVIAAAYLLLQSSSYCRVHGRSCSDHCTQATEMVVWHQRLHKEERYSFCHALCQQLGIS